MLPFTVLIWAADMLSVGSLRYHVETVHPSARCLIATSVRQANLIIQREKIDLLLVAIDAADGDTLDFLFHCARSSRRVVPTLALTGRGAARILVSLRSLRVQGVIDSVGEPPARLEWALHAIASGRSAWSDTFLANLQSAQSRLVLYQLTPHEQLGLAVLGNGCGDRAAAECLGMQISSVRTMRQEIYAKLDAHGTDDIVRLSAQLGYTRFSERGISAFGVSVLVREYTEQSKRPRILPQPLLSACGLTEEAEAHWGFPATKSWEEAPGFHPAFEGQSALCNERNTSQTMGYSMRHPRYSVRQSGAPASDFAPVTLRDAVTEVGGNDTAANEDVTKASAAMDPGVRAVTVPHRVVTAAKSADAAPLRVTPDRRAVDPAVVILTAGRLRHVTTGKKAVARR